MLTYVFVYICMCASTHVNTFSCEYIQLSKKFVVSKKAIVKKDVKPKVAAKRWG